MQLWLFSYKHFSQVACKIFAPQLKHKTGNKTTCKAPSANLSQPCTHQLKSFPTVVVFFRISGFPDFFGKAFLITYKFSKIDFSTAFQQQDCNKNSLIRSFMMQKDYSSYNYQDSTISFTWENSKMFSITFKIFQHFQKQATCKLSHAYNKGFS